MDSGNSSINETMHQTLSTQPAVPYILRFSLLSGLGRAGEQNPPGPSPVFVTWGSQAIGQFTNPSNATWAMYQFNVIAASSQTELNFACLRTRWQLIDGISVTAVPEPSTVALLAVGSAALIVARRRGAGRAH